MCGVSISSVTADSSTSLAFTRSSAVSGSAQYFRASSFARTYEAVHVRRRALLVHDDLLSGHRVTELDAMVVAATEQYDREEERERSHARDVHSGAG